MGILAALGLAPRRVPRGARRELDTKVFLSGFFTNVLLAASLTFLGDRIGLDLYLVALFAFGLRLFQNAAIIRRHFLSR